MPAAAGTEDGDKPPGGEQRVDAGEVVLPADEAGQRRGQVAPLLPLDGVGGGRRPLGPQQAQMALAQGGARVGAEGVGQGFAEPLVPGECLGLTSLGGERVHEQGGGPFLDVPLGEQGGQTGGGGVGAAQGQLGLGEVGDGLDRDMGQPDRGGGRHRGDDGGLGAGTVAPQVHGLAEQDRRGVRGTGAQPVTACGGTLLEPQRVHIGHVHVQPVAAPELGHVTGRTEGPAQPRSAAEPSWSAPTEWWPGPTTTGPTPKRSKGPQTAGSAPPGGETPTPRRTRRSSRAG